MSIDVLAPDRAARHTSSHLFGHGLLRIGTPLHRPSQADYGGPVRGISGEQSIDASERARAGSGRIRASDTPNCLTENQQFASIGRRVSVETVGNGRCGRMAGR